MEIYFSVKIHTNSFFSMQFVNDLREVSDFLYFTSLPLPKWNYYEPNQPNKTIRHAYNWNIAKQANP